MHLKTKPNYTPHYPVRSRYGQKLEPAVSQSGYQDAGPAHNNASTIRTYFATLLSSYEGRMLLLSDAESCLRRGNPFNTAIGGEMGHVERIKPAR